MIPEPITAAALVAWRFLRDIPWQVWALAMLVALVWHWGDTRFDAGIAAERARWEAAQAEANAKAQAAQDRRDQNATTISTAAAEAGQAATLETRTDTAAAVEIVKYVTRTVEIPANCPVGLPGRVLEEGRAAVDRARAAARGL